MLNVDVPQVTLADMKKVAAALTKQCRRDFAMPAPAGYGVSASVRVIKNASDAKPWEWVLALISHPDVAGALGYHDQTAQGLPLLKIFPLLDIQDGSPWSVTASHEVLESLADPNLARAAQAADGKFWAYEVCDGVEATSYKIDGVPVSNFELPPYFEAAAGETDLQYDFMGVCTQPMQTLPGGYNQWFDPTKGWQQVQHASVAPRKYRQIVPGRSSKRRG